MSNTSKFDSSDLLRRVPSFALELAAQFAIIQVKKTHFLKTETSRKTFRDKKLLPEIFSTLKPFSNLLIDCAPQTPDILRIRTLAANPKNIIIFEPTKKAPQVCSSFSFFPMRNISVRKQKYELVIFRDES